MGPDAEGSEAKIGARGHEGVENVVLVFDRVMEFPSQLADKIHAQRERRRQAHVDPAARQPSEALVGEIIPGEPRQQFPRSRAGNHQYAHLIREVREGDRAVGRHVFGEPVVIQALQGAGGNDIEALAGLPEDREFGVHPTATGQRVDESNPSDASGQPVRDHALQELFRSRPLDPALGKGRHVQEADVVVNVQHLVADRFEPPRPAE